MKIIETSPRKRGFVLWGHYQNLLDDPRRSAYFIYFNFSIKTYVVGAQKRLESCGCSKEPSHWRRGAQKNRLIGDGSFEHPKHISKLTDKMKITILPSTYLVIWTYEGHL